LRLRKSDHGDNFLQSVAHTQQAHSLTLHSTSRREAGISQAVAAVSSGPQNTMSHPTMIHPSRLSILPSHATELPLRSSRNQFRLKATHSALRPDVGPLSQSTVPLSVITGYRNVDIDPRLFSQVFTTTRFQMTQLQHQQQSSLNAS
jgi:hypothetical protein